MDSQTLTPDIAERLKKLEELERKEDEAKAKRNGYSLDYYYRHKDNILQKIKDNYKVNREKIRDYQRKRYNDMKQKAAAAP